MKKDKKIILVIIGLLILIGLIFILQRNGVINLGIGNIGENIKREQARDITFLPYSNENNKLKILVTVQDVENGIQQIKYISEAGELLEINCQNKTKVSIDYEIKDNGEYEFRVINGLGEEFAKTLVVDEEYRKNLIDIQISIEPEFARAGIVSIDYHGYENKSKMYKIGENGAWINYTGEFAIDSYEIIIANLHNTETKTVTIYARIEDSVNNRIIIGKEIINLNLDVRERFNYDYSSDYYTFTVPESGNYMIGTWGSGASR